MQHVSFAEQPYKHSVLVERTMQTRAWSVIDLDGTFAAGSLAARRTVRKILAERSAFIFSTARTPELVMSSSSLQQSQKWGGCFRQKPKWHCKNGVYSFVPVETLEEFHDCLDPDAIFSFGEGVFVKKVLGESSVYFSDTEYERIYLDLPRSKASENLWRTRACSLVRELGIEKHLAPIEVDGNYTLGKANVEPLKFRIQLDFYGRDAVEEKYRVLRLVREACRKHSDLANRIEGVDESKPNDAEPDKSRATLYLMPPDARKENMLNRALARSCAQAQVATNEMSILIAGDTLTDFYSGCYAGWDADVVSIIVGGSRLARCIEEKVNFAGVDLRRLHNALKPTEHPGIYSFDNPLMRGGWTKYGRRRKIILGDTAYPGTIGAETILAYLEDKTQTSAFG